MNQDPRLDGTNTNPPDTRDYWRLAEATDIVTEWEISEQPVMERLKEMTDLEAVLDLALTRMQETQGLWSKPVPDAVEIADNFLHVWAEGLMHGIVFHQEKKTMNLFGMPDANLVRGAGDKIRGWEDRAQEWAKRIDPLTMTHVAMVRSIQATQILHDQEVTQMRLREIQFSHWTDGWLMGYLFQDLGGHRDD